MIEAVQIAGEAGCPNLLITTVTNTTSRGIPQVCDHMRIEALEATRSNFGVSLLANTASMAEAVQVASKATCTDFGITSMTEAVQIAGEAGCPNLLIPTMANTTTRGIPQECNHIRIEACEASSANLAISALTSTASMEKLIQETRDATHPNLFESSFTLTTAWILKIVI